MEGSKLRGWVLEYLLETILLNTASPNAIGVLSINHKDCGLATIDREVELEGVSKLGGSIGLQIDHLNIFLPSDIIVCGKYKLVNIIRPRTNIPTKCCNINTKNGTRL